MPTKVFPRWWDSDVARGYHEANRDASNTVGWWSLACGPGQGYSVGVHTRDTVAGPTNGIEFVELGDYVTPPLAANATISGTVTFNLCCYESNMSANATIAVQIQRLDKTLAVVSDIVAGSSFVTELGTAAAAKNWTVTPTSTSVLKGERLRILVYYDDVGTMASAYTLSLNVNGPAGGTSDSYIQFNETLTFMNDAPAAVGAWTVQTTPDATTDLKVGLYSTALGMFVFAGNGGKIWTSTNGTSWTNQTTPGTTDLGCIAEGNGSIVVGGGSGVVWSSTNGTTWGANTVTAALTVNQGVVWCPGISKWVFATSNGNVYYGDLSTWSSSTPSGDNLFCVAWDATNSLLIVGDNSTIYTSSDASAWTSRATRTIFAVSHSTALGRSIGIYPKDLQSEALMGSASTNGTTWTTQYQFGAQYNIASWYQPGNLVPFDSGFVGVAATRAGVPVLTVVSGIGGARSFLTGGQLPSFDHTISYGALAVRPSDGLLAFGYANGGVATATIGTSLNALGQALYITDVASDIADQSTVEKKAWTTAGTG